MQAPAFVVQPEHVCLCFLATAVVVPPPAEAGWGDGFDGPAAQRLLALFLLEELHDAGSPTLSPLPELLARLARALGAAGAVLARVLTACLQSLATPDDLVGLGGRFACFLAAPGTTPAEAAEADSVSFLATSSPLGMLLRRVRLGLSGTSMQGLAALAAAIQRQLHAALGSEQQAEAGQPAAAAASDGGALKEPPVVEAYLNGVLSAVESLGACLPAGAVAAATAPLAGLEPGLSKLQYLQLAVNLAHRDVNGALAALHAYFDGSGSSAHGGGAPAAAASAPPGPGGLPGGGSGGKGRHSRHQAALHSLASLHAELGHPQEALAALQELLRLGQQQGDEWGLLHGLAGLCRVMGSTQGLQPSLLQPGAADARGAAAGWGLLDLRRTQQQLQLQALLRRCLAAACDMRAPHIAAFAAVALCRHRLQHSGSAGGDAAGAAAAAAPGGGGEQQQGSAAGGGTSLAVQRMLLDVATLEHQAAVAAAAPGAPVPAAAAAAAAPAAPGQPPLTTLAARSSELYNPTEAFGTGTSSSVPGSVSAAGPNARAQPPGLGWRASAAAVSQALATAHVVAAAALQLQGASSLAGVRTLMLLTGPGGAGMDSVAGAAAAAAAAAGDRACQTQLRQQPDAAAAASGAGGATGFGVRCDDAVAGWVQLVQLAQELHGTAAAGHVLCLAERHFAGRPPCQLAAAREMLRLRAAVQAGALPVAWQACADLAGLAPPLPQLGLELQLAAAEAHVQVLLAAGCWADAHAAGAALFAAAAGASMQPQAVGALLLMARAALQAGDAAGALPYALSALLHCQALQLDGVLPEAVLLLAAAWQELAPDGAGFVLQLLQHLLPLAHAAGGLRARAQCEDAVSRTLLALAERRQEQQQQGGLPVVAGMELPTAVLSNARRRLSAAAVLHEQAGDRHDAAEVWLLLAHVCGAAGLEAPRNEAAARWQACCGA